MPTCKAQIREILFAVASIFGERLFSWGPFSFCNYLTEQARADGFTLTVLLLSYRCLCLQGRRQDFWKRGFICIKVCMCVCVGGSLCFVDFISFFLNIP